MGAISVTTSVAASLARVALGREAVPLGPRPERMLELYDFEGCPFCRKAREALSLLDLDAKIWPCPKQGPHYREELRQRGGRAMFPYLVDPNTGKEMYESDDIVAYLFETYGDGAPPALLRPGLLGNANSAFAGVFRGGAGVFYREARSPEQPLELWSYEASPFCRLVRERLSVLELPYLLHNVPKGSARREAFVARSGKMQVPYLVDPNTGVEMFESSEIVRYLDETYAATG